MPPLEESDSAIRPAASFATTQWSLVREAGGVESSGSQVALEALCHAYWPPLYAFIRRKGLSEEDAKDLTQAFLARLLERKDFQKLDPHKGKFRTFLLASLTHFLSNARDHANAAKRGGGKAVISLHEFPPEQFQRFEPATDVSPDKVFDQRWAMALLERAVEQLRHEMVAEGRTSQFEELKGFLTAEPREGEYALAARRLQIAGSSVGVWVHRMRQRYRELVRAEVASTVSSPMEVEEEMRYLRSVLES